MTYLLVIYFFAADGRTATHNMALFVDRDDCRIAGQLITDHINSQENGVVTKFSCDDTA